MQSCTIIIFGATGDLAKQKLLPALYHLDIEDRLTADTRIICMGRKACPLDEWHDKVTEYITVKSRNSIQEKDLTQFLNKV
ncbi:MAG TPA: glucose-6-phosphate dehydrogenase, partial [Gammaproteobacteria bacterium]|nr:glucose-6-phosphate dehydrogenase [Gammaproteobacteria bacterium]